MGVYVEKATLSDDAMDEHASPMKRTRDDDAAMALVASKAPRTSLPTWQARSKPFDDRRGEQARWTPLEGAATPRYCRSMGVSRKRRLSVAEERPTKYTKKSSPGFTRSQERFQDDADYDMEIASDVQVSRPRTLQYALPGLSSRETLEILGELVSVGFELQWLNSTRPEDNAIIPVFGWRAAVWSISSPKQSDVVVYKSAKAFEGVAMHTIARKMWSWRGSKSYPDLSAPQHVYAISKEIRIVRQTDSLHGREPRSSLWLECIRDQGESIVMVRKELYRFQDTISGVESPSERECQGYILHPLLVPMRSQIVAGAALHFISSLRTRGLTTQGQVDRIVSDMPRHVLQWEDCFVHDTSRL